MSLKIVIEYCAAWNYAPRAVGLTARLLELKNDVATLELVPSGGGVYEVDVNGVRIFSKKETGAFPDEDALVEQIRSMV